MRAAVFYDVDDIRIEELPDPVCGPGDVVVATKACGICTGELMPWYMKSKAPFVFGHEPAGEIVEVGRDVKGWAVGDPVFVHHHAPCFTCRRCRRGDFVMCETWKRSRLVPGGMAERFLVAPVNQMDMLRLPEGVGWDGGALVEPLACALRALDRGRIRPGDRVLVIGLGFMGQLLVKAAWSYGAERVMGADYIAARRRMALDLGASDAFDPAAAPLHEQVAEATGGEMADVVLVGPPQVDAMEAGLRAAGEGAHVVLFSPAPPGERLTLVPHDLYFRDVTIAPSYSCGPEETRRALGLIAAGAVRPGELITHRVPFARVAEGYEALRRGGEVVKVLVDF